MTSSELRLKAMALRSLGSSYASISAATGLSNTTLQNLFRQEKLEKGSLTSQLLQKAKADLLNDKATASMLRRELQNLINTEISLANIIFDNAAIVLEQLESQSALNHARGLASISSAVSTASSVIRKALTITNDDAGALPSLTIMTMTAADIDAVRKAANDTLTNET